MGYPSFKAAFIAGAMMLLPHTSLANVELCNERQTNLYVAYARQETKQDVISGWTTLPPHGQCKTLLKKEAYSYDLYLYVHDGNFGVVNSKQLPKPKGDDPEFCVRLERFSNFGQMADFKPSPGCDEGWRPVPFRRVWIPSHKATIKITFLDQP